MSKGTLYLVATPIGNLKDITLRALQILKKVDLIACEDTRHTGGLLTHYQIKKPLLSYYEQNELARIPEIIDKLKKGQNIAQVTDAGTPTISDPGFKLVRECIAANIKVESIPGASAVLAALTVSGLPTDKFLFLGYLPKSSGKAKRILENLKKILAIQKMTVILFESPHRLIKTLQLIQNHLGDIDVVICRELTKLYEEVKQEKVTLAIDNFSKVAPKGEFTIVF